MMVEWVLCIGGNVNDEMIICENKIVKQGWLMLLMQHTAHIHTYTSQWFALVVAESDMV